MHNRQTEVYNHSRNLLSYESETECPHFLHSASKYTKRIPKAESKKVKTLRNSLKIQKQLTSQLNARLNYKLSGARKPDEFEEMADIEFMLNPVPKVPSSLSRCTTASSLTELCSQEYLENAMFNLKTELGVFEQAKPRTLPDQC